MLGVIWCLWENLAKSTKKLCVVSREFTESLSSISCMDSIRSIQTRNFRAAQAEFSLRTRFPCLFLQQNSLQTGTLRTWGLTGPSLVVGLMKLVTSNYKRSTSSQQCALDTCSVSQLLNWPSISIHCWAYSHRCGNLSTAPRLSHLISSTDELKQSTWSKYSFEKDRWDRFSESFDTQACDTHEVHTRSSGILKLKEADQ